MKWRRPMVVHPDAGRSPCGERGLKSLAGEANKHLDVSLPVRGAWVEMPLPSYRAMAIVSLPVRGAWVEMG